MLMRTLVSYLNDRNPQDLRLIAEKWEANQIDRLTAGNSFQLAHEMSSEFLQRRLLEKLTSLELAALQFFVHRENFVSDVESLANALDWSKEQAIGIATALTQMGLLFNEKEPIEGAEPIKKVVTSRRGGWSKYLEAVETVIPTRDVLVMPRELARSFTHLLNEKLPQNLPAVKLSHAPLQQLLESIEPENVENQTQNWGLLSLLGTASQQEIIAEMANTLADSVMQQRTLERLPEDAQTLFARLKKEGRTSIPALLEEYVSIKRLGRSLRPLTEALLVWEVFEDGQSLVFVPEEIRHPTASALASRELSLQTVAEPTQAIASHPVYALAWDILTFLNYIGQNEVELTKDYYIPRRHFKKIFGLFWVQNNTEATAESRFNIIVQLCNRLHLIQTDNNAQMRPGPEFNAWLAKDFYEQLRQLFNHWLENAYFFGIIYYPYYYNSQQSINQANQKIMKWLQECEVGVWYSFDSFLTKIQREDPYFIKSRKELMSKLILSQIDELARHWNVTEANIISQTLTIFSWFGLIKISTDSLGKVVSFSLTAFGAELTKKPDATPQSIPPTPTPLLVQPNFEIMLLSPQVETLWALLKFTTQKKLDLVSIYILDRTAVMRGMETGFTTTAILEWLARRNPQALPQNVEVSVQDWGKGFKRVTVEQSILLEVDSAQVLDELMQSKKYADYFVRRLSPTAAIVKLPAPGSSRSDPLKSFRTLLKNGGFFAR